MKAYLAIRKWIDYDLSRGTRVILNTDGTSTFKDVGVRGGICYLLVGIPVVIQAVIEDFPANGLSKSGAMISLPVCFLIVGFIFWRQWRLLKARSLKSGRYYERKARFSLSAEYVDSEDALLAHRRARSDG